MKQQSATAPDWNEASSLEFREDEVRMKATLIARKERRGFQQARDKDARTLTMTSAGSSVVIGWFPRKVIALVAAVI